MNARETIEALRNCERGKCEECDVIGQDYCQDRLMGRAADCIEELSAKFTNAMEASSGAVKEMLRIASGEWIPMMDSVSGRGRNRGHYPPLGSRIVVLTVRRNGVCELNITIFKSPADFSEMCGFGVYWLKLPEPPCGEE